MRVLLYSDVHPSASTGGELVLQRHLIDSSDFEILCLTPESPRFVHRPMWSRIRKSRLFNFACTVEEVFSGVAPKPHVVELARRFSPDVVLTVAHGRGYHKAAALATKLERPLVTIYHDWWPDLSGCWPFIKRIVDSRFQHVARQSSICLCVSEGMCAHLGQGVSSIVLPPIPGPAADAAVKKETVKPLQPFRIGYFGNLSEYGELLAALADKVVLGRGFHLEVRGTNPTWTASQMEVYAQKNILLPFADRNQFAEWVESLDAVLCVMSFDAGMQRRMETSFPSKLLEGLRFGKPIVLWGPEYCSAVKWANEMGCCACVTSENAEAVATAIEGLATNPPLIQSLCTAMKEHIKNRYSHEAIHSQFVEAIRTTVRQVNSAAKLN